MPRHQLWLHHQVRRQRRRVRIRCGIRAAFRIRPSLPCASTRDISISAVSKTIASAASACRTPIKPGKRTSPTGELREPCRCSATSSTASCFPTGRFTSLPVLDGAFSPNQRLDQARRLGEEIERPDDLALGPDGALYVSTENRILRCAGEDFSQRERPRLPRRRGRRTRLDRRRAPARLRLKAGPDRAVAEGRDRRTARQRSRRRDRLSALGDQRRRRDNLPDRWITREPA